MTKNNLQTNQKIGKALINGTFILLLFFLLMQLLMFFVPTFKFTYSFISHSLLTVVGPVTFVFIVAMLWKKEKPKLSIGKGVFLLLGLTLLNFAISLIMIAVVDRFSPAVDNPIGSTSVSILDILNLVWSLAGEEAVKLASFFVLYKGVRYDKNRKKQYWLVWLVVSLLFGLLHLTTYDFNFLQCIFAIGVPSIIDGYLWKKTERPLMMLSAHVLFDMIIIGLSSLG
ncbi:CPBP family glutamic-type intramembrane protease [Vagococcus elongatus]|uniref:CAAX prenyl protease 2/Lysostaphin resistance protein A-like domain-containing protein n=1 Tax=Vagococcus elongatus TaxID=180344 RepID=A0A430ALV1_9ENTE|nr:CPBP family glutamic-type intramembrane protease [Vagococcus elongatus]RSU08913.1 hypothetical protein CBF29_12875 [Vagococcus elongatus]